MTSLADEEGRACVEQSIGGDGPWSEPTEDLLGPGFQQRRLRVTGRGGHSAATLVRHLPEQDPQLDPSEQASAQQPRGTVIYVHGWSDYFSNPELARAVSAAGYRFYALDLHGYGRNLTDDVLAGSEIPGYAEDLSEYAEDLEAAAAAARADGAPAEPQQIVWIAHSTGGLVVSLALLSAGQAPAGLALSTPWIAAHTHDVLDTLQIAALSRIPQRWRARGAPTGLTSNYFRSLSAAHHGEWILEERWRPPGSFPMTAGFLLATARGRQRLLQLHREGAEVGAPVLMQTASATLIRPWWRSAMMGRDTVLDVRRTRRRAGLLSRTPRVIAYDDGLHDIHRSVPDVRRRAFRDLQDWLREILPEPRSEQA